MKSGSGKKKGPATRGWLDAKSIAIAVLSLLLWTTNRRRRKPDFEASGRSGTAEMIPTLVGITEGAIDRGNRVEVIHNGHFFDLILEDIAAASQSIHIESYIWWKGEICIRIAETLAARGQAGVEVRLLVDASGASSMEHRLVHLMRQAGCEVRLFNPFRISNVGRLNIRTHRKIAVFDEITVGFTDPDIARQLREDYLKDLERAREIHLAEWQSRPWTHKLLDASLFLGRREL